AMSQTIAPPASALKNNCNMLPPNDITVDAAGTTFQFNNGYTEQVQSDPTGTITGIVRTNH
ncbi:hypothetical protein L0152_30795, partial [bacterium]|nr:hypothetical protein [bacterium]